MTHPESDGVIRGAAEAVDRFGEEEDDPLRGVRHMLDRLYAHEGGTESEYVELISQILLSVTEQSAQRHVP